jgi:hypothetical protein
MCVRFCLPLPIIVTLFIFPFSAFIFLTLTPNFHILFIAIPQHSTVSPILCIGYTTLLETPYSHFWWDVLPCCFEPHWLNNTFIFLGLSTYLTPWRFVIFTTDDVNYVKNFQYVFSGFLCCVGGLVSLEFMTVFNVVNLWIGLGFIFESCS